MSNFEVTHAGTHGIASGRWQNVARLLRNWNGRRKVRNFRYFDDRILDDIGVTREEVAWASSLPVSVNAALALQERSSRRRQSEFEQKKVRWSRRAGASDAGRRN